MQVVETVVTTTLQTVDSLWPKLNEYDVNQKLSEMCMPPAVLKYGDLRCISYFIFKFSFRSCTSDSFTACVFLFCSVLSSSSSFLTPTPFPCPPLAWVHVQCRVSC